MNTETTDLKEQWKQLQAAKPNLRIRDAAQELGVSEAELLATRCGEGVSRIEGNWQDIIKELPRLGNVMCLTRNEQAVHERYGVFREVSFFGPVMGQVVGPDIDLRLFTNHWHIGFAVADETKEGIRHSLQFFDFDGTAVHKVYLQADGDQAAYDDIVSKYRSENQATTQATGPVQGPAPEKPDSEIDVEGFRAAWLGAKDTHDFFIIMRKFGVSRIQALRLAPEGYAVQVPTSSTKLMLEAASSSETPIMVFIGSAGCLQIHTGPVKNIKMFGTEWLNVLDDEFNMHLKDTEVTSAWIVRKPTQDGEVTSLELFNAANENIVLFFGKRKPGQPEDEAWRKILADLPRA